MDRQPHLVTVWDPTRTADAMSEHSRVLLEMARRHRESDGDADDVYVWWGKIRSSNRQRPLPHLKEVIALEDRIPEGEDDPGEMHLYLTDYRSLYVGHLVAITTEDVKASDPDHVPAYYMEKEIACDCWFKLWDLRRIVQDDTLAVVAELRKLRNTHYNDRPVSIYGGMVDLPLVVFREDEARYFDPVERERTLEDRYWVEFDAENAGLGAIERELRDNLFGDTVWLALDVGTRAFVATAERTFREHRGNAAFDFSQVIGGYAKAVEVETNRRLRAGIRGARSADRMANIEGRTHDLGRGMHLTLGQLVRVLTGENKLIAALGRHVQHSAWFTGQLPSILDELRTVRNEGAHSAVVDRDTAVRWRNRIVGVGCNGILAELGRVTVK